MSTLRVEPVKPRVIWRPPGCARGLEQSTMVAAAGRAGVKLPGNRDDGANE